MNYERVINSRIPGMNRIAEERKKPPLGQREVPEDEVVRRLTPLVNGLISGAVPLDDATKEAFAHVAEHHYRRYRGMQRGHRPDS